MSTQNDTVRYFIVTYTNWTHTYFIQTLTADDIRFTQRTLSNEEVYSKFYVESSVDYFNKLKKLTQANTDISFNIEYGDY
jgi:hypothetical protein